MANIEKLEVRQKSMIAIKEIYTITQQKDIQHDFALIQQIRKSAISIASNIAEGSERETNKEFIRFLHIARGSLAETKTQLKIIHIIYHKDIESIENILIEIHKMINGLINYLSNQKNRGKST